MLDVFDRPIADWDVVMKWLFDKIVGGARAALRRAADAARRASPIKLDSRGPVFFKQKRYGFNNELIEVYKFRSMYADMTDAHGAEARHQGRSARHPRRPLHPQDQPRRAAAALQRGVQGQPVAGRPAPARRATPRPRTASTTRRSTAISPATASSPASPAGRRSTAGAARPTRHEKIQRRVEHDLYYIENWSVLFDLYILAMTPLALLKTENAY